MQRREFLKSSCTLCMAFTAGLITSETLISCTSFPVYEAVINANKISVPISIFQKQKINIIHAGDLKYYIALEEKKNGNYTAFLLECTHASTPLNFTGKIFMCPLHGSRFDEEGKVIQGPATLPLKKLTTKVSGNEVMVLIS